MTWRRVPSPICFLAGKQVAILSGSSGRLKQLGGVTNVGCGLSSVGCGLSPPRTQADPGEQVDLAREQPQAVAVLTARLLEFATAAVTPMGQRPPWQGSSYWCASCKVRGRTSSSPDCDACPFPLPQALRVSSPQEAPCT